jgi:hypothetical protein
MIRLVTTVQQAGGDMAEAWLSGIYEDGACHSIRLRQDFELRIAEPVEFKDDADAVRYLNMHYHDKRHHSTGSKIFQSDKDSPGRIWFLFEIEELS